MKLTKKPTLCCPVFKSIRHRWSTIVANVLPNRRPDSFKIELLLETAASTVEKDASVRDDTSGGCHQQQ